MRGGSRGWMSAADVGRRRDLTSTCATALAQHLLHTLCPHLNANVALKSASSQHTGQRNGSDDLPGTHSCRPEGRSSIWCVGVRARVIVVAVAGDRELVAVRECAWTGQCNAPLSDASSVDSAEVILRGAGLGTRACPICGERSAVAFSATGQDTTGHDKTRHDSNHFQYRPCRRTLCSPVPDRHRKRRNSGRMSMYAREHSVFVPLVCSEQHYCEVR